MAKPAFSPRSWSLVDLGAAAAVVLAVGGVIWSPKLSGAVARATGALQPVTVTVDASIEDVIESFVENRGSSIVVLDEDEKPIGRILADDVVDALIPQHESSRRPFTRLLA